MWMGRIAPDGAACGGRGASRRLAALLVGADASGGDIFGPKKPGDLQ